MANRCIFGEKSTRRNGSKENAYERRCEKQLKILYENYPPLEAYRYFDYEYETERNQQKSPLQEQRGFNNKPSVKKDWAEMVEEEEMEAQHQKNYKPREDVSQRIKDVRERYKGDANRDKTRGPDFTGIESLDDLQLSKGVMTSTPSKQHAGSKRTITDRKEMTKQASVFETDSGVLKRRQKQIDYGKNTLGYGCYALAIRKASRTKNDPRTPDKHIKYSRNSWDMQIKLWRKKLHNWDPPSNDQANESCDLDLDLSSEVSFDISEASSVPASSSSPDYLTQDEMDIGYGSSPFQEMQEISDNTLNDCNNLQQLVADKSIEEGFCDISDLDAEECTYLRV